MAEWTNKNAGRLNGRKRFVADVVGGRLDEYERHNVLGMVWATMGGRCFPRISLYQQQYENLLSPCLRVTCRISGQFYHGVVQYSTSSTARTMANTYIRQFFRHVGLSVGLGQFLRFFDRVCRATNQDLQSAWYGIPRDRRQAIFFVLQMSEFPPAHPNT
jgi:hypothetical protein